MDFEGETFLVTGASSGIGRVTARELNSQGAFVILNGRDEGRLTDTRNSLVYPDRAGIEEYDLSGDLEGIVPWVEGLAQKYSPLHGLLHSAGISKVIPLKSVSLMHIEEIFRLNLYSAFFLIKGFRKPKVRAQGNVSAVIYSSITAAKGEKGMSVYSASKGGIVSMVRALSVELSRETIRVNCLLPGLVSTNMAESYKDRIPEESYIAQRSKYPLGIGTPEDVSQLTVFLLSKKSQWITGSSYIIDGGYSL
jgi:3-oxoacyl-[acyl-carrier protein] reductase